MTPPPPFPSSAPALLGGLVKGSIVSRKRWKERSHDRATRRRRRGKSLRERERERERERDEFWWNLLFWVGRLLLSHSNLFLRRKIKYCINAQNRNPHIESSYILLPPPPVFLLILLLYVLQEHVQCDPTSEFCTQSAEVLTKFETGRRKRRRRRRRRRRCGIL